MMYLHYCKCCQRIHMLNGHKMFCPKCESKLTELRISYLDFVGMNREERNFLVQDCQNDALLAKMSANYRMYKYSKWYKKLQSGNTSVTSENQTSDTKEKISVLHTDNL